MREKISSFCNVPFSRIIPAVDVGNIYDVPMNLHQNGLDSEVLSIFNLEQKINQISLNGKKSHQMLAL